MPGHTHLKWQYQFEKTFNICQQAKNQLHPSCFPWDIVTILWTDCFWYFGPVWLIIQKGYSGPFCPNWSQNFFPWNKALFQFFNIWITFHCAKNQKNLKSHSWEDCWRDTPKTCYFINFFVKYSQFEIPVIDWKILNLTGQECFGPYLRNQNFSKYEICSSIACKNYSNTDFHYRPHW